MATYIVGLQGVARIFAAGDLKCIKLVEGNSIGRSIIQSASILWDDNKQLRTILVFLHEKRLKFCTKLAHMIWRKRLVFISLDTGSDLIFSV